MDLHSAEYFVKSRDYWWNQDFLELMGKRWDLKNVRSVLDVGCGIGHWGLSLKNILPEETRVTGIDKEVRWIEEAKKKAHLNKVENRYTYVVGKADNIPFSKEAFDMVTCQTLLIHVGNVQKVLSEMLRDLKPDGILVLIEPNNIGCSLILSTLDLERNEDIDEIFDVARFQFICERGKMVLNEGYFSLGDQLPGYLSSLGVKDIKIFISDKARPLFPPYEPEEQKIIINEILEWSKRNFWIWIKEDAKKYYKAGGGDMDRFESYWTKTVQRHHTKFLDGIKAGKYSTSGGRVIYCIS